MSQRVFSNSILFTSNALVLIISPPAISPPFSVNHEKSLEVFSLNFLSRCFPSRSYSSTHSLRKSGKQTLNIDFAVACLLKIPCFLHKPDATRYHDKRKKFIAEK